MSYVSIPVETELFFNLVKFLKDQNSSRDPVVVVSEAIEYWMDNASWKNNLTSEQEYVPDSGRGYSWKNVFLPSGTLLRIKYGREYIYAKVESDSPVYKGEKVSPNRFALVATGSARDAWRDVWVKRPQDSDYVLADTLRRSSAQTEI